MKRLSATARSAIHQTVALAGCGIVLLQALFIAETQIQLSIIVAGLTLYLIGCWKLGYSSLRGHNSGSDQPAEARLG